MLNRKTGRPFTFRGGSKAAEVKLDTWDGSVRWGSRGGRAARGEAPPFVDVPLSVAIEFRVAWPAGHWRKTGTPASWRRARLRIQGEGRTSIR